MNINLDIIFIYFSLTAYLKLVEHIRNILPNVALSSDFICGFCGETEEEFTDTESLISIVKYNVAYLFEYSMREVIYFIIINYN